MNGVGLIGAIIIGIFAGWIAEKVMNRRHGLLTNLVVGLIGALIGGRYASGTFHRPPTVLHVSKGLGSLTPLRFRCPPDVTLLRFGRGE